METIQDMADYICNIIVVRLKAEGWLEACQVPSEYQCSIAIDIDQAIKKHSTEFDDEENHEVKSLVQAIMKDEGWKVS